MEVVVDNVQSASTETADKGKPKKLVLVKAPVREVLRGIRAVAGVARPRAQPPILTHVLLRKHGASVKMTASDMDHQLDMTTEVGFGDSEAAVTVEARKALDLLKALPEDDTVTVALEGTRLSVSCAKSRFVLQTRPADEFPLAKESVFSSSFTLPQKVLKNLLDCVSYAMAVHDVRYFLCGVMLQVVGDKLVAVATDGHRLAVGHAGLADQCEPIQVILHHKAVLELARLLEDSEDPVSVHLSDSQAAFAVNGVRFLTKLVEGKFPDYNRVMPATSALKTSLTLNQVEFMDALRRAALIVHGEKTTGVRLRLEPGVLFLDSEAHSSGETSTEEMAVDYAGPNFQTAFNVNYLLAAVQSVECDQVMLGLRTEADSVLFHFEGKPQFKAVVMPMKL